jgi:probable F420-dependent oxidoreductase
MSLPLEDKTRFGIMTEMLSHSAVKEETQLADRLGYDSIWTGDHLAFTQPMLEPMVQLAHAAAYSDRLMFGTSVYLLPMRHPTPVAKLTASLDHVTEGRFIFGVGVGGEFPLEYAAAGVAREERGARLTESMQVLRKLWSGEPVSNDGKYYAFPEVRMEPATYTAGGPPIWCGGRSAAALKRTGRLGDGYISYVVTADMFAQALDTITAAAEAEGRDIERFGTAHLLFARIDKTRERAFQVANEHLTGRYAMDFSKATERYVLLGPPEAIAEGIRAYHAAGIRHFIFDPVSPAEETEEQRIRFAEDVLPLLSGL